MSPGRIPQTVTVWALLALSWGCSSPGGHAADSGDDDASTASTSLRLASPADFKRYPAALDPLPSHEPAILDCGVAGMYVERADLEVDTAYCNYVLAEAPARAEVRRGDRVSFQLRHFDLTAPEPASAHVAIYFGDDLQWETAISIPHDAQVLDVRFSASRPLGEGEPIRLHLHNHGQNNWGVGELRVGDGG